MERKILVALDGSTYSQNVLHYLGHLFFGMKEVSLHLLTIVSGHLLPEASEWMDKSDRINMLGTEGRYRYAAAKTFMTDAVMRLKMIGMKEERVTTEVQLSRAGVAADILFTARKGLYDAVVIGRRGLGRFEELIMGSVSSTFLEKCYDVPIWLVDGQVDPHRFLVPVDLSPYTLRAVDHLAYLLNDHPSVEITLFHSAKMLSGEADELDPAIYNSNWSSDWIREHMHRPDAVFHAPEQILCEQGFPAERIHRLETKKGLYVSRQIIRQALIDDIGTIVMGRRPHNHKKGWLGGVSDKVVANIQDVAIWLVT